MANQFIRLLDSDVISNVLITSARSDITLNLSNPTVNYQLFTTQVVLQEVQTSINRIKATKEIRGNQIDPTKIKEIIKTWNSLKGIFKVENVKEDPSLFKNRGERSLVEAIPNNKTNVRVVSNNKADVMRLFKSKNINQKYYQFPFEFYEEMEKFWFSDYKEMIRFIILCNHDFKIIEKKNLGNILIKIRLKR